VSRRRRKWSSGNSAAAGDRCVSDPTELIIPVTRRVKGYT